MGFLAANRIGPLKNDMDVDVTFEGANPVMMQQVCRLPWHPVRERLLTSVHANCAKQGSPYA
jgi:hypothetical protein